MPDGDKEDLLIGEMHIQTRLAEIATELTEGREHALLTPEVYALLELARLGL